MSVFNRLVLRNNAARTATSSSSNIMYRPNNPLRRMQKRLFSGEWTHAPLPPDATWLERWAMKNEMDWVVMLVGDFMANAIFWSTWIYRWLIESDAHKIDWHNNFEVPPVVPGKNCWLDFFKAQETPFQWKYNHHQVMPARRPYQVDGYQIDDPINGQI